MTYEQCKRNQYRELRLVRHQAKQESGEQRPAVDKQQPASDKRGGQEAILPAHEVDDDPRKCDRKPKSESSGSDAPENRKIASQRYSLEGDP